MQGLLKRAFSHRGNVIVMTIFILPGKCQQLECKYYSRCVQTGDKFQCACKECFSSMETQYNPVCGRNGVSYANQCFMRKYSCENQLDIQVAKATACGKRQPFPGVFKVSSSFFLGFCILIFVKYFIRGKPSS